MIGQINIMYEDTCQEKKAIFKKKNFLKLAFMYNL
jgi:hypothetical protein